MKRQPFRSVLVANRGEIAVRLLTAAREMGLRTVAVYSDADVGALHVCAADRAERLGPAPARESYLRIDAVIDAARRSGAEAIHPGYGFLSENAALPEACEEAGLVFIGPPASAMRALGDKAAARQLAQRMGVPTVPGYDGEDQSDATLAREAAAIGWPLLVKPSAGGGGKGMRVVPSDDTLQEALAAARREALAAFGDERLVLERFVHPARHVEIQVFADAHGDVVHLFERECSVQRRHQKIVEESPSPALDAKTRDAMGRAAVALTRAVGYRSAGTLEFLLAPDGSFYFLEMNTRLQVEHPVTEAITGIDLARLQLREAMGEALGRDLGLTPESIRARGHAIECRIYAEDAENGFLPAAGAVLRWRPPSGPNVRVDSGITTGSEVSVHYDPILAKVIVWDEDRDNAIARAQRALADTVLLGLPSNIGFLQAVLAHPAFRAGETTIDFVQKHLAQWRPQGEPPAAVMALALLAAQAAESAMGAGNRRPSSHGPRSDDADAFSPWDIARSFRLGEGEPAS